MDWIGEDNSRIGVSIRLGLKQIIHKKTSKYFSSIIIADTTLGRTLLLSQNGDLTIQTAELYDFYDEIAAHVPMTAHPNPSRVLIIGGGDGVILREVLKYKTVKEVFLVEIDQSVIKVSKEFLRLDNGAFNDPRVKIIISDAAEFLKETNLKFDVIIGDYSDPYPDTPAGSLMSEEFYRNLKKATMPDSITVLQTGSPLFQREIFCKIYRHLKALFQKVKPFWIIVPYYPGGLWTFIAASDETDPAEPVREPPADTIFYNTEIHKCVFCLPQFMRDLIK
ncbi:MAG: fused MFS/spermidine synthase [Crenarchaeota archaeon]|nr:fused MFS/spermidine synthase [Thermoproteota archaeon]